MFTWTVSISYHNKSTNIKILDRMKGQKGTLGDLSCHASGEVMAMLVCLMVGRPTTSTTSRLKYLD